MTVEEKREKNRIKNQMWRNINREKCCQSTARWRIKNPDYETNRKLKNRYGITPEQYTEILEKQNGKCAICGNEETAKHHKSKKVQKLAVDHCYKSGKVRGILCQDCNRGIGKFHDDISILENAIKYLILYKY